MGPKEFAGALEKRKIFAAAWTEQNFFFHFQPVRNPVTVRSPKLLSVCCDAVMTGKLLGRFGAAYFRLFQELSCPRHIIPNLLFALFSDTLQSDILRATVTES